MRYLLRRGAMGAANVRCAKAAPCSAACCSHDAPTDICCCEVGCLYRYAARLIAPANGPSTVTPSSPSTLHNQHRLDSHKLACLHASQAERVHPLHSLSKTWKSVWLRLKVEADTLASSVRTTFRTQQHAWHPETHLLQEPPEQVCRRKASTRWAECGGAPDAGRAEQGPEDAAGEGLLQRRGGPAAAGARRRACAPGSSSRRGAGT